MKESKRARHIRLINKLLDRAQQLDEEEIIEWAKGKLEWLEGSMNAALNTKEMMQANQEWKMMNRHITI